jgi:PAS domain S-box-containing protein
MINVLIVDDESVIAMQLEERLQFMGYNVLAIASSGKEAVLKARELKPDIILMDIVMDGRFDGIEASRIIKSELDIPVILVTAFADDNLVNQAKEVEPYGYIVKPFQEREIKASIEVSMYKRQIQQKLKESEEKYRAVFDYALDALFSIDAQGLITSWNKMAESVFGYFQTEIINTHFAVLLAEPFQKGIQEELDLFLKTGQSMLIGKTQEYIGRRKDGSEFPLELSVSVWANRIGTCFTVIVRDIAKLKKTLAEKEQLITELKQALEQIKVLRGILPVCTSCKKIRNDQGYWQQVEEYISQNSDVDIVSGLCPDCAKKYELTE